MKIRIAPAPQPGFYFLKGEFAWFYGFNFHFFHLSIHPGSVSFEWVNGELQRHRHFEWKLR